MTEIKVGNVSININYKFDGISDSLKEDVFTLLRKGFTQKLDRYLEKKVDPQNLQGHLNITIRKNSKWLYDGNFNFRLNRDTVIYKREWFKNLNDLINHFFDHVKEEFSKK